MREPFRFTYEPLEVFLVDVVVNFVVELELDVLAVVGLVIEFDVEMPITDASELAAEGLPFELPAGAASQPAVSMVIPATVPVMASLVLV
jgi:hypothetical protein